MTKADFYENYVDKCFAVYDEKLEEVLTALGKAYNYSEEDFYQFIADNCCNASYAILTPIQMLTETSVFFSDLLSKNKAIISNPKFQAIYEEQYDSAELLEDIFANSTNDAVKELFAQKLLEASRFFFVIDKKAKDLTYTSDMIADIIRSLESFCNKVLYAPCDEADMTYYVLAVNDSLTFMCNKNKRKPNRFKRMLKNLSKK